MKIFAGGNEKMLDNKVVREAEGGGTGIGYGPLSIPFF